MCNGRLTVYGCQFALLSGGVVVDRRRATARRRGGEPLDQVLSQSESDELYQLSPGFFLMYNCAADSIPQAAAFQQDSYLNHWMTATRLEPGTVGRSSDGFGLKADIFGHGLETDRGLGEVPGNVHEHDKVFGVFQVRWFSFAVPFYSLITVRRYALHGLSYRNSVRPPARLSVCLSHSCTVSTWFNLRS